MRTPTYPSYVHLSSDFFSPLSLIEITPFITFFRMMHSYKAYRVCLLNMCLFIHMYIRT
ncbi:hypothetical protein DM02DRAFT_173994 [Periconia macrospinosa]|uniref:Uncharacterized protein n=1 Tax=Periconia macrospinosa TaxID=97972 RepID=A0A2V1D9Z7_9PLEO|nr:hypothetical protein DM02DRAFT_173994 [Periconia macrospinosa]